MVAIDHRNNYVEA